MICPKCQYERGPSDSAPDYECPNCGVIYAKYDPAADERKNALRAQLAQKHSINQQSQEQIASIPVDTAQSMPPIENNEPSSNNKPHSNAETEEIPGNLAVCTRCEEIGQVREKMPGNGWVELVLYLFWIAPGIIYSVWRRKGKIQVCGACGSDQLVAAKTRAGQQIIAAQIRSYKLVKNKVEVRYKKPIFGKVTATLLALFCVVFSIQGITVFFVTGGGALGGISLVLAAACGYGAFNLYRAKPSLEPIETEGRGLISW